MRPVYHWNPDRIKAHIAICFLAYAVAKQAIYRVGAQYQKMSFENIREELLRTQASILRDTTTGKYYRLPAKITNHQRRLYQVVGLKRFSTITTI